jgi:WD40 repeat protein
VEDGKALRQPVCIPYCKSMKLVQALEGHEARVWHVSWAPSGLKFASCGEDKVIRIWAKDDTGLFQCIATLEEGQSRTIRSCEWSPDGCLIASASFDGSVVVWQTLDKRCTNWERSSVLEGHDSEVKGVAWSSDGNFLATCGRDKKVWIWERLLSGDFECVAMLDGHSQDVKFVKWHPTANVLYSCSYDDSIKVWVEDDGDWYCSATLTGHSSTVWGLALDASGSRMVTVSDDKFAILWECDTPLSPEKNWRIAHKLSGVHSHVIFSVDWSHHSGAIVTGAGDNCVAVYTPEKSEGTSAIVHTDTFIAHDGDVNCVRWNPAAENCNQLLTCGDDTVVKLWTAES